MKPLIYTMKTGQMAWLQSSICRCLVDHSRGRSHRKLLFTLQTDFQKPSASECPELKVVSSRKPVDFFVPGNNEYNQEELKIIPRA